MNYLIAAYWVAIIAEMLIRAPISRQQRGLKKTRRQINTQEKVLLGLLFLAMFFAPLFYSTTSWFDFANYTLPNWAGWLGIGILSAALFVFWRSHADLGLNWSPSLEIREKHELVTRGIYAMIRHPMYASQWLWVFAQPLLLQNWVAGWLNLLVFLFFYPLRVRAEEQMLLEQFGEQYRSYQQKVGAVFLKF